MAPQRLARLGGALYLVLIAGGLFGEIVVRGRLVVAGDAGATARNLLAAEPLWRAGAAVELSMLACATALAVIFYVLLRPAGRDLALLAVLFNLIAIAIEATNELHLLAALAPLEGRGYGAALAPEQLHVLAHLHTRAYVQGFGAGLIYFGIECVLLGILIHRSGYLPRAIGVLMVLAGVSYLVNSFALIVAPPLAGRLFPAILLPALVGEASLCLWLLLRGVDPAAWAARAARPPQETP